MKLDVMTDFNSKKSRTSWVRGNIGGFFTSLLAPQSAQKNINYQQLSPVPIVIPPLEIQQRAVQIYQKALTRREQKEQQAQALLAGIDAYLLSELGITLPQQKESIEHRIFKTKFSQALANRLDAGYHQKFHAIFSKPAKYSYERLKNLLIHPPQYGANEEASDPQSINDVRYIRITDIDEYGNLKTENWKTAKNVDKKYRLHANDILFARSGSVGRCYIHKANHQDSIFAGYLIKFILDFTKINPEYFFYYCHSAIYKAWVSAIQRPSVQANINAEEYKGLLIPLPPIDKQNEIAEYISDIRDQAKRIQAQGEQILADAKTEVERMILGDSGGESCPPAG
ncbi:restriction endonuclease subunit S [Methylomonas sp. TEB]|uniref:restriction endonuclease subunit S n=1 Tax=Methylomonas sp. TEB TaxID=3398229 RepID=UPI0039F4FC08